MPVEIRQGTMEEKILRRLLEVYPITLEELRYDLKVSEKIMMRTIKALQVRGIIELEVLPGKTFVRLLRRDFLFLGRNPTQKKRFKHSGSGNKLKDYEGPMFG